MITKRMLSVMFLAIITVGIVSQVFLVRRVIAPVPEENKRPIPEGKIAPAENNNTIPEDKKDEVEEKLEEAKGEVGGLKGKLQHKKEEQEKILQDPNASPEEKEEAKKNIEELDKMMDKLCTLEPLLGFAIDALILYKTLKNIEQLRDVYKALVMGRELKTDWNELKEKVKNVPGFGEVLKELTIFIKQFLKPSQFLKQLARLIKDALKKLWDIVKDLVDLLGDIMKGAWTVFKGAFNLAKTTVRFILNIFWKGAKGFWGIFF